jgi:hypothetical protein
MESILVESWVQKKAFDLVDRKVYCLARNLVAMTVMQ